MIQAKMIRYANLAIHIDGSIDWKKTLKNIYIQFKNSTNLISAKFTFECLKSTPIT